MDKGSCVYEDKSLVFHNIEINEYVSASSDSLLGSDCDLSLEVQLAQSLERMRKASSEYHPCCTNRRSSRNYPSDRRSPCTLQHKCNNFVNSTNRKKLLEKCKLKLMGSCSNNSIQKQTEQKKRNCIRNCVKKNIYANSAPIHPQCSRGVPEPSKVTSHSLETVNKINNDHCRRRPDKHNRKCGEHWTKATAEKSSEANADKLVCSRGIFTNKVDTEVGDTLRQVYATSKGSNIRDILKCQNPNRHNEDPKKPCFCKHCGMADLLIESQKRLITDEQEVHDEDSRSADSCTELLKSPKIGSNKILKEMLRRMRALELAIQRQEQNFVTKEYLKLVVDKIISYIAPKQERQMKKDQRDRDVLKINTSIQCTGSTQQKDMATMKVPASKWRQYEQFIGAALSSPRTVSVKRNISPSNSVKSITQIVDNCQADLYWRWGDETIKPGLDLKDKVIQLINDAVIGHEPCKLDNDNEKCDIHIASSSEKTLYLYGSDNQDNSSCEIRNSMQSIKSGTDFKKMLDLMSEKIYADYMSNQKTEIKSRKRHPRNPSKALNDNTFKMNMNNARKKTELALSSVKSGRNCCSEKKKRNEDNSVSQKTEKKSLIPKYKGSKGNGHLPEIDSDNKVRVTYMSPKAGAFKESCVCFKVEQYFQDFIDNGCKGTVSTTGKFSLIL